MRVKVGVGDGSRLRKVRMKLGRLEKEGEEDQGKGRLEGSSEDDRNVFKEASTAPKKGKV